jgi:hypothetical protein
MMEPQANPGERTKHMKKELFNELTQSLKEAGEIKRGALKPRRVFHVDPRNDLAKVRGKLGFVAAEICAASRDQYRHAAELGTRPSRTDRSCQIPAEDRAQTPQTSSRSGVGVER